MQIPAEIEVDQCLRGATVCRNGCANEWKRERACFLTRVADLLCLQLPPGLLHLHRQHVHEFQQLLRNRQAMQSVQRVADCLTIELLSALLHLYAQLRQQISGRPRIIQTL